jgi:hypothetical protein
MQRSALVHTRHPHKHATPAPSGPTRPKTGAPTVATPGEKDDNGGSVSADDIRLRAYRKWESAGKPTGDGVQFWLEAEQELTHGK